ncbi:hypothetical protein [Paeniglutamicibacter psychrophenolicus]|uniref:hypothetical protein n=1 Tax=Paeniglutamicibacter psychrophenolicus TaxID=257454 RepID=UPI00277E430D|nr:hypothetical protein [Paeniglutamicibacter psychrophenolicus]MDQ0094407.1 hypothetical protein [Paeniglutamicibacter psychrophenolicus]
MSTANNATFAKTAEHAINATGLEGYKPYEPRPLVIPERITSDDVAAVILESLEAGNDPAEDPDVQRAVTRHNIANYTHYMQTKHAYSESLRHIAHIKAQRETLIAEMKEKFDAAAEVLRDAHKVLGDEPLWDRNFASPGDKNAIVRIHAQAALYTTDLIVQNWSTLMFHLAGQPGVRTGILHYLRATAEEADRLGADLGELTTTGRKKGVWDALCNGITVDLATDYDDVRARAVALSQTREQQRQAEARAQQQAAENAGQ